MNKDSCKNKECEICKFDCQYMIDCNCQNFKIGRKLEEYWEVIKDRNTNLHSLCKRYNLKYYKLMDMLNNKIRMSFKYRVCLEDFLYSKEIEWEKWELEGSKLIKDENIINI